MEEKDIETKMQEAWNDQVTEQPGSDKEALWQEFATQAFPVRKKGRHTWVYPVAAAIAILFIAVGAFIYLSSTQSTDQTFAYTIIENPSSIIKSIALPDSSVVELEPGAEIHYAENFVSNRNLKLTGKAFFKVHKDKKHPFKVYCNKTTTTVLGTCFTINGTDINTVQVHLYEGRVQMNVTGKSNNWILSPGEQFVYNKGIVDVTAFNRFQDFNNSSVSKVLRYIITNYGYRVEMPDAYLNKKITLRLNQKEDLQNVVDIIAQMYDLKTVTDVKQKKITFK